MKLAARLGLGFGLLLALVALVGGFTLWEISNLSNLNKKLYEHPFTVKSAVLSMDGNIIRMHHLLRDVVVENRVQDLPEVLAKIEILEQKSLGEFETIRQRFLGEPEMYLRVEKLLGQWRSMRQDIADLLAAGQPKEALEKVLGEGAPKVLAIVDALNALKNFAEGKASEFYSQSRHSLRQAFHLMYFIVGLTIILGVILAFLIARSIIRPAREIAAVSHKIAQGDLNCRISYEGKDEIGQMAASLRRMLTGVIGEGQSIKNGLVGPVWTADTETIITYLNPEAARLAQDLTGWHPEMILGRKKVEEVFQDQEGLTAQLARQTLALLHQAEGEVTFGPEGDRVYFHQYTSLLRDLDGEVLGVMGVGANITDRVLAEQEKAALEDQLRQSQKMESIGTLAGGVAHDFNNILSAIIGYTELALDDMPPDHPLRRNLEQILQSGWRARNLVAQLLAFSRKQMLELKTFSPNQMVEQARGMLLPIIGEDVYLEVFLNPDAGRVRADFHQLEQVLMNLVANAREAMPTGGKISIETDNVILDREYASAHLDAQPGSYVMLAVSDNGMGMDQETVQRIFDPFFTTKEVGKGTGLGLSMVYGIVKQLGGNIYVYSEPGQGSVFKIYLPRVEGEDTVEAPSQDAPGLASGNETILVVEDDQVVRRFIRTALSRLGYQVLEAEGHEQAEEIMSSINSEVDLLITDVIMPEMSGRELSQKLLQDHPDLRVLYISGYTANVIVHHGVLDQGVSFLQKPVSLADLAQKVREILEA